MKEPHFEGEATHKDLESCVRERKLTDEALTGANSGWVWSHENFYARAPTLSEKAEGKTHLTEMVRGCAALRGLRPHT